MKPGFLTLDEIRQLFSLLKENDVTEFSLDRGDEKIALKRGFEASSFESVNLRSGSALSTSSRSVQHDVSIAEVRNAGQPSSGSREIDRQDVVLGGATSSSLKEVRSPMVGTFFSRPSPDSASFVSVGDRVIKGQVLCIIEAMKVMNEVESDVAGRVSEILLSDGQVVEFEEVIFRIDPAG